MKIFIGQAVTGEDINKLREESKKIVKILEETGNDRYCTVLKGDEWEKNLLLGDKLKHAFNEVDKNDCFLAIVRSEKRSEGMLMEIGYAISKNKKLILAINESVQNTYLREMANKVIEFKTPDELNEKLKDI
ncbi:MAG: hypothetical protein KJ646_05085 [Nanoarchaeota archaeon]|nr:hypothetical protein [Nanoarchaeota archaeon]MBU4116559.1 hypothetical protein [Nanoarchaeota archaeon]